MSPTRPLCLGFARCCRSLSGGRGPKWYWRTQAQSAPGRERLLFLAFLGTSSEVAGDEAQLLMSFDDTCWYGSTMTCHGRGGHQGTFPGGQGVISLTFGELSKVFSWNLCIAEIVVLMRISSWNFVSVPKAWLWAHVQSFSLKFYPSMWFPVLCIFARLFWESSRNVSETTPRSQYFSA